MAYITVGSTFTPLTYEERIKPYQEYIAKAEKLEDQYNKELLSLTQLNSLLPEGSQLKVQSQQLIDRLNNSIDLLQSQGWDRETKKELNDLRRSTQAFISPATNAITKYEKYIDERMALENQYGKDNILFRDSYTIDDFANNKSGEEISHHPSYINMNLLDKDVMSKVVASSSTTSPVHLRNRTQGDNVIGTYYKGYSYKDAANLTGNLATIYEDTMTKLQKDYGLTEEELAVMDERVKDAIILGASQTYKEYDQIDNNKKDSDNGGYSISNLRDLKWIQENLELNEDGSIKVSEDGIPVFKNKDDKSNKNIYTSGIGFTVPESQFEDDEKSFGFNISIMNNTLSNTDLGTMTSIDNWKNEVGKNRVKLLAEQVISENKLPGTIKDYNIYIKEVSNGWFASDNMQIYLQPKSHSKIYEDTLDNGNSDTTNLS